MTAVSIVGGGGWGSALAALLGNKGIQVKLWTRRREHAAKMQAERENAAHLPGVVLPDTVGVTDRLDDIAAFAQHIILVVPSQALRSVAARLAPTFGSQHRILNASKG